MRQLVLRFGGLNHIEPGVGWVDPGLDPGETHHFCSGTGMGFGSRLNPSYGDWFLGIATLVTRTRRRQLMAVRALDEGGVLAPGAVDPELYRGARNGYFVSNDRTPWREVYARELAAHCGSIREEPQQAHVRLAHRGRFE